MNALSLLAGICLVAEEATLTRADRATLIYDIFDFDTRGEISQDEMVRFSHLSTEICQQSLS